MLGDFDQDELLAVLDSFEWDDTVVDEDFAENDDEWNESQS
jgi:hypothetical protein